MMPRSSATQETEANLPLVGANRESRHPPWRITARATRGPTNSVVRCQEIQTALNPGALVLGFPGETCDCSDDER